MSWRGAHRKYVCVPCRVVRKDYHESCEQCRQPMTILSYKWRPPRKNNHSAWKRIEAGDWLWENPKPKASDDRVYWNGRGWKVWREPKWSLVYRKD